MIIVVIIVIRVLRTPKPIKAPPPPPTPPKGPYDSQDDLALGLPAMQIQTDMSFLGFRGVVRV